MWKWREETRRSRVLHHCGWGAETIAGWCQRRAVLRTGSGDLQPFRQGGGDKGENYVRYVPLCPDGVFWAATWEVRVGPGGQNCCLGQAWNGSEVSAAVGSLGGAMGKGVTQATMVESCELQEKWVPLLEASPFAEREANP